MKEDKFSYESEIQQFWEKNNIYLKVKERNSGNKSFNFVEGPPYPTGDLHLGHMRNWAVKDSVLRFKRFCGFDVYAKDGYDAHGLPVENKVQKKLNLLTVPELKKFGVDNFIKECRKFAYSIIDEMTGLRSRYGFWMDREKPYLTFHPEYISFAWRFFKIAQEKKLLYKDYRTVGWCPNDETTLSDYEIKDTYKVLSDPSIYVKFPLRKEFRTTDYEESLVIWTTTPWTLQSNMAIAVNPKFNYAKALFEINGKEEVLIVAEELVEKVVGVLSKSNKIVLKSVVEVVKGAELEGIKYEHIYLDETPSQQDFLKLDHKHIHSVVLADYVSLGEGEDIFEKLEKRGYKHAIGGNDEKGDEEDEKAGKGKTGKGKSEGTGLVHIAPGHGFEDYDVGKRYNLPIFCPVNGSGHMTEGKYEGAYFKDVDPIAIKYLKEKGVLLHHEMKEHKYPCCWRCKTPIVYRATDQWWIKRAEYTQEIVNANSNVRWYPKFAQTSFNNLMEGAGDWAISRQRYWGIPMPVWEDEDGNYEVVGSKEELEKKVGHKVEDLHLDDLRDLTFKGKDGKEMKHIGLTTDVWYESGCASFASHHEEGLSYEQIIDKYYPMSWITEGEDQIRGWFSSLFGVGHMVTGKAPYKQVLFQGFVMAKDGTKMSKSLGNGISGNEAIEKFGADATRYYLLTKSSPEAKLNFDIEEFSLVDGYFNTLENVFKFCESYLSEHELRHTSLNVNSFDALDQWILFRLNETIGKFMRGMENYKLNLAFKEVEDFIVNDFSKVYLKLIKERTEVRDEDLLVVMNEVLKKSLIMISCAVPFRAEKLYKQTSFINKKESVFLELVPEEDKFLIKEVTKKEIDVNFELAQNVIASILNARERAKIGVRWALGEVSVISVLGIKTKLEIFEPLIKKLTNIKKISYDVSEADIDYIVKPNFATLKQDFSNPSEAIKAINMNKFHIAKDLKNGLGSGIYEGVSLDLNKHIIKEIELKGELISSEFSGGNVILHTHQDEILLEEGYLRELMRRVQSMRKDLSLNKKDEIEISFDGSDEYFLELVNNWESVIKKRVGASDILMKALDNKDECEIKGKKLVVSIRV